MIRAYTTNHDHAAVLQAAAEQKGFALQIQVEFDAAALEAGLGDISLLIFDLHDPAFPAEAVMPRLEAIDHDRLPPVLFILSGAAQVPFLAELEDIANQDYTFPPLMAETLALRLEVLSLLGQRRRRTLESAITDRLTGLYNRKYFLRRLEEELYRAQRYGFLVGVVLADVDFSVDSGKLAEDDGTAAIRQVAELLTGRLRKTDVVARFRWSEFGILLPNIPAEDSLAVARDLKQKVEALSVKTGKHKLLLKASVGQLVVPVKGLDTALEAVEAVEDCAFAAKSTGDVVSYEAKQDA